MGWPQITLIALYAVGFGLAWAKHGKPRENHDAFAQAIAVAITVTILWFGGFWS